MTGPNAARPRISIVVAYSSNRIIGAGGKMPWHLPEDLKRFKALTMGHPIVMGRKTWESIGRLLPGRRHLIVSRRPDYTVPGATVVASLGDAISACADESEVFVIGGGEIYAVALHLADRIYATEIDGEFVGDTYFPEFDMRQWHTIKREQSDGAALAVRYSFVTLERVP